MNSSFNIEKEIKHQITHVRKCCYMLVRRREEAELLESEVLEKIWDKKHLFNGSEKDFKGWSYTIARNIAITNFNKMKYKVDSIDSVLREQHSVFISNNSYYPKQHLKDVVYTIKSKFKEKQVEIFKQHVIEGYKIHEIAKRLEVPEGTVKHVVHAIRKYVSNPDNIISELTMQVA